MIDPDGKVAMNDGIAKTLLLIIMSAIFACGVVVGAVVVHGFTEQAFRVEAVAAGVARWVADETSKATFEWRKCDE